jgi:hypothetical protein
VHLFKRFKLGICNTFWEIPDFFPRFVNIPHLYLSKKLFFFFYFPILLFWGFFQFLLVPILLGMQKLNLKIHLSIKIGKSLGGYIWIIGTGVLRGPIVLADFEITPIEVFWGDGSGAQGEEPSVMRGDQGSARFFVE